MRACTWVTDCDRYNVTTCRTHTHTHHAYSRKRRWYDMYLCIICAYSDGSLDHMTTRRPSTFTETDRQCINRHSTVTVKLRSREILLSKRQRTRRMTAFRCSCEQNNPHPTDWQENERIATPCNNPLERPAQLCEQMTYNKSSAVRPLPRGRGRRPPCSPRSHFASRGSY